MKLISHRANLNGIDLSRENNPKYIDDCINKGFDVEIDLRQKNNKFYLGHDLPQYEISSGWLSERKNYLLVHIKEIEALKSILKENLNIHYFCHEKDDFTVTSENFIWCHNLNLPVNDKTIVPLLSSKQVQSYFFDNVYALCTDYIFDAREKYS